MNGKKGNGGTDFMRYVFMGLAIVLVVILAIIMVNVYRSSRRDDVNIVIEEETEVLTEEITETESAGESETESESESESETETAAQTESETESGNESAQAGESESATERRTVADQASSAADESDSAQTADAAGAAEAAEPTEASEPTEAAESLQAEQEPVVIVEDTEAPDEYHLYATIASTCNLRSTGGYTDANGNDSTIGELYGGTVVEVLEDNGGWARVSVNGTVGYVGSRFLAY